MKIAVCAKVVPEQARRIDPETNGLDRSGEQTLNPFDANAVEEALRLKGNNADAEVVLISLGPERSLDALRKALAMGADRVVLVSDEAAAGSDLVASSYALARALDREQADLVLFGQQANDSDGAVMWAAVADRLRRPLISQVAELTVTDGTLRGKRQTEFGYDVIEAPLPAVVAVSAWVAGAGVEGLAAQAGRFGAAKVYIAASPDLAAPLPQPRVDVAADLIRRRGFDTVVFGATVLTADVAAGLAARLDAGL